jgi:hypothetical protein
MEITDCEDEEGKSCYLGVAVPSCKLGHLSAFAERSVTRGSQNTIGPACAGPVDTSHGFGVPLALGVSLWGVEITVITLFAVPPGRLLLGGMLSLAAIRASVPEHAVAMAAARGVVVSLTAVTEMNEGDCIILAWADYAVPTYTLLDTARRGSNYGE